MISGVINGGIFLSAGPAANQQYKEIILPNQTVDVEFLRDIARATLQAQDPVAQANVNAGETAFDVVAQPLKQNDSVIGAVVFTLSPRNATQRESVQQLMQWCVVWLENLLESRGQEADTGADLQLQAMNRLSDSAPLAVSGYRFCSYLADEFGCSLVALGLLKNWDVRVSAVSYQTDFNHRTQAMEEVKSAMQECADQDVPISLTPGSSDLSAVSKAHGQLLNKNSERAVCSIPIRAEDQLIGVLTFVRSQGTPFTSEQQRKIAGIVDSIGPLLKLKTVASRSVTGSARNACNEFWQNLVGQGNARLKTITSLVILVPLLLAFVPAQQKITAPASLEGSMQRAMVAPIDGYIKTVLANAGDTVKQGQTLLVLNNTDLVLQLEKLRSERDKINNQYQLAWANRDKGQIAILSAQLAQSDAQLALIENQMDQSEIHAPFDGQIIRGDLSHLSGAPVQQGQLLFELVPLTGFKLTLDINEYDVGKLSDGQSGVLRLTGKPGDTIAFTLQKALPVASIKQDKSVFRVEAELKDPPTDLRPGMQGIGKIAVGDSRIGLVWTQSLRERLKMIAWYFGF